MLFFAVRSTVPEPPPAEREPMKFSPAPDEFMTTLPALAVIDEATLELKVPLATASKSPVEVRLDPVKLRAPVLLRKTPLDAFAVTFVTCETSRRPLVPVPIEPFVEVRFN